MYATTHPFQSADTVPISGRTKPQIVEDTCSGSSWVCGAGAFSLCVKHLPWSQRSWHRGVVETAAASGKETVLLGLRTASPPLALSILLAATRRHLDTCHIPSTGSSQEAEGARAVLEDFLEEEGRGADQQHPSRCCPPYPEVPQAALQGQKSCCVCGL